MFTLSAVRSDHLNLQGVSRAVSEVDIPDLADRFQEWLPRIENGRANEFVHLETTGRAPTSYSRMARFWGQEYEVYWNYPGLEDYDYYYLVSIKDKEGEFHWLEEISEVINEKQEVLDLSYRYVSGLAVDI